MSEKPVFLEKTGFCRRSDLCGELIFNLLLWLIKRYIANGVLPLLTK